MSLTLVQGDILDWPTCRDTDKVVSLQQVNIRGVYGAGLAKSTRLKYPKVYQDYMEACTGQGLRWSKRKLGLGDVVYSYPKEFNYRRSFCLLAAQSTYGKSGLHTEYEALDNCLSLVRDDIESSPNPSTYKVLIPYKMSCGYGGGDWPIVLNLINKHIPWATIVKLSE